MQHPFRGSLSIDFHKNQSTHKWLILIVAAIIGGGSIVYTKQLVDDLKERERANLNIWARGVELSAIAQPPVLDFLVDNVVITDSSLPVIIIDSAYNGFFVTHKNVIATKDSLKTKEFKEKILSKFIGKMSSENDPIKLEFLNATQDKVESVQYVFYRNSHLLRHLSAYPYVQLAVIAIFWGNCVLGLQLFQNF